MNVPLLDLKAQYQPLRAEIRAAMDAVCDSQMFILGKAVSDFEQAVAGYCHCAHACGVTSGSDALIIALMVEGIGAGDEVIVPSFTFFATAGAVARVGATPVFADIDPDTFNLDPVSVAARLTPRTKAIIPVHLFGQTCEMEPLLALAREHRLIVIEDACQAIGAEYEGRRAGSLGDYGCFSFFPSKNLGCFGDGGLVTTNDPEKAKMLAWFRNHGAEPKYYHKFIGGNFRLDALQAAILSVKLKHLDAWSTARQQNAAEYRHLFQASPAAAKVKLPVKAAHSTRHVYNQFSILVPEGRRDGLLAFLKERGIGAEVYYPVPLHLQECFASLGGRPGDLPVCEDVARRIFSLPIYPETTRAQREYVVATIAEHLAD
jgi:dTDP-4-amino-4,6-dideoxygalactose transaminase